MKLRISVEGKTYEVEVEVLEETRAGPMPGSTPLHSATAAPPVAPPPAATKTIPTPDIDPARRPSAVTSGYVVEAPIVGTIMQLKVAAGDTVVVNQVLLVMEAMKMETNIASPIAGKIKSIHVAAGQAVKAGQVLVEFE
jgi:biotin carboxyl carrier protein